MKMTQKYNKKKCKIFEQKINEKGIDNNGIYSINLGNLRGLLLNCKN